MFEVAELTHKVNKADYQAQLPALRTALLEAQAALKDVDFPVIILISGVDGAGKGETVNILNEWMDPRYIRAFSFGPESDEERERPEFWRYWRSLPPKGHIGLYVGSWYSKPIAECARKELSLADFDANLKRIRAFESMLVEDGALIIKFWLHLSEEAQKKRLDKLKKNPETSWRVTQQDLHHLKTYKKFATIAERSLRETSTGAAPWVILDGRDARYRSLTVGQHVLERINQHLTDNTLEEKAPAQPHLRPIVPSPVDHQNISVLGALNLDQTYTKKEYSELLARYQAQAGKLTRKAIEQKVSTIMLFEGWDAAGKGGLIRRFIQPMDARHYQVIPIAAPTDEEAAHHYLWRFWRHIPRAGDITFYDRSWYGRVLVERVEGFSSQKVWMRGYSEINDFEEQLTERGILLLKFWVHISKEEQLIRFKAREKIPFKKYKITEEDYRNREQWDAYEHAVNDMVERTSTEYAPWHLIAGNDKRFARIKALKIYCKQLEKILKN
ncbi:MAG: polyphosphate:AMP phosphotransferase [Gammaproteobacteria bacterium]|nr:polyphosphate:AMP phosphotransferase [Gammaproteobacteria bacterium]